MRIHTWEMFSLIDIVRFNTHKRKDKQMTTQEKVDLFMPRLKEGVYTLFCYEYYDLAVNSEPENRGKVEIAIAVFKNSCSTYFMRRAYIPQLGDGAREKKSYDGMAFANTRVDNDDTDRIMSMLAGVIMCKTSSREVLWRDNDIKAPNGEKCYIIGQYLYKEHELK